MQGPQTPRWRSGFPMGKQASPGEGGSQASLPGMLSVVSPGGSRDWEMIPCACAFRYWKELGIHPESRVPPSEILTKRVCMGTRHW